MALRLLVEGLDWGMTEARLAEVFGAFGDLSEARIAQDWETGRSRGFGWVTFVATTDGEAARTALDGQKLAGKLLRVMVAPEQTPRAAYRSADYGYTNTPPSDRLGPGGEADRYRSADYSDGERGPRADRRLYRSADFGYVGGRAPDAMAERGPPDRSAGAKPEGPRPDVRQAPHPVRPDVRQAPDPVRQAPDPVRPGDGEAATGPTAAPESGRARDPFG